MSLKRMGRLVAVVSFVAPVGCGALTSKGEFNEYERAALERDPERQIALAALYARRHPDGLYLGRLKRVARLAEPAAAIVREQREAAIREQQQAMGAARRAEEERRRAEAEAARQEQERQAAAQVNAAGIVHLPSVESEIRSAIEAGEWDRALSAVNGWLREYGTTPSAARAWAWMRGIERGRVFASVVQVRGARRLDRPLRRFVREGDTVPRRLPEDDAPGPPGVGPLAFGAPVDVWFEADGGWFLVAPPEAQEDSGSLASMTGWLHEDEITARDVAAEEQRRAEAEARREAARREAEARREEDRREAEARREGARRAREEAARQRNAGARREAAYVCYRDCMNRACPGLAACWELCGWDTVCARGCTGAFEPCSDRCKAECGVE